MLVVLCVLDCRALKMSSLCFGNPLHRLTSLEVTLAKLEEMGLKRVAGPPGVDLRQLGRGRCVFVRVGPPRMAKRRSLWFNRFAFATKKGTHNKHTHTHSQTHLFSTRESEARTMPNTPALVGLGASAFAGASKPKKRPSRLLGGQATDQT